jgi:hypothetical protein
MTAPDDDLAQRDLEKALAQIDDIAAVLAALGDPSEQATDYLASKLKAQRDRAHDAFCRIYKLDKYREGGAA